MGDHTESFQVDYDPSVISYSDLLNLFWASHSPHVRSYSTQYKAVAFYGDDEERAQIEASKQELEQRDSMPVYTEILPLSTFYRAEDYHQKYYLRGDKLLMKELHTLLPNDTVFADSTLAARLNGYLGSHGFAAVLERELSSYGLSDQMKDYVLKMSARLDEGAGGAEACAVSAHGS